MKEIINRKKTSSINSRFRVNDKIVSDKKAISDGFNSFFVNVGPDLAKNIPLTKKSCTEFLTNRNSNSMFLHPVTEEEIKSVIKNLKISSPGWGSVSPVVLKDTYEYIVMPLTYVFNLSLLKGVVPVELKAAKVIPLFKSGDKMQLSNYRPVSVLPLFSKILERIMYSRLLSFVNSNTILYAFQFGFRAGHSPELALLYLVDKISNALEEVEYVLGLFLDFSKVFDTVNHDILFSKLEFYGIRGLALDWFRSYLTTRSQYVEYNGTSSSYKNITCGVPQGSILGPLLFLIYINDLASVSKKFFSVFFADDSNLFISGKNPDRLVEEMNKEKVYVTEWLKANKLSLNLNKTHFIIFRKPRSKIKLNTELIIDGVKIDCTRNTKFLGVMIDQHLNFFDHIQYIKCKVSRGVGVLYKCRKYLKQSTLIALYYAFVYPYFTYCLTVWGQYF